MKQVTVKNVVWREGKYYVAQCLDIDISSFGQTRKEAEENLNEALELYFEDIKKIPQMKVNRPQIVKSTLHYA